MKKSFVFTMLVLALVLVTSLFSGTPALAQAADGPAERPNRGRVVVANRGSGSISVIDAKTGTLIDTYALPAGPNPPEPMYVVYSPIKNRVFVGDRANSQVVVFNARTFEIETTVPTGAGVFHMWGDRGQRQLWVVGDMDRTVTVIDLRTLETLATIPIPADLAALGGIPHDVILDPSRDYAYVTIIGVDGPDDYVVQYSSKTFEELNRAPVGGDAHVSLARQDDQLYVPSQAGSTVHVFNRETLEPVTTIAIPGAHGAGMRGDGQVFYTTNLPGGGVAGIWAIDTRTNQVIGTPVDTPYSVPHNLALTPDGRTLFLTHSGPNDKVTIYTASRRDPIPVFAGEVTVGLNPFGLTYIP